MKKGVRKFIIAILIAIMLINIIFPIISSADWTDEFEGPGGVVLKGVDGVVGVLWWGPKVAIYLGFKVIYMALSSLVSGQVTTGLTPDDIIFSGANGTDIDLISINFFGNASGVTKTVSDGIAKWYFALRNLAIIVSLVVLIYVGIRMAISSVASEKAKYKQMLKDWALGFAMLFVLHYLIVAVIALNREFVNLIYSMNNPVTGSSNLRDLVKVAEKGIFSGYVTTGYGSLLVYGIIVGITVAFFIQYVKRFFTVGFLIAISPLITVTYSIDKMGDGKSQALNVWLREFIFNVVIQPFHCIIYVLLCSAAINSLSNGPGLKEIVVAVAALLFVFKAEDIVKNIFGFRAGSMENAAAAGALAWGFMSKFQSNSSKAGKAAGKVADKAGKSNAKEIKRKSPGGRVSPKGQEKAPAPNLARDAKVGFKPDKGIAGVLKNAANGGNALGKLSVGQAAAESIMNKVENLKQFEADPLKSLGKGAAKLALKSTVNGFKLAPKLMTGGIVGGMTGNAVTGFAAGYVSEGGPLTGKFSRKMIEHSDKDLGKLQEDSYTKRLANAIDDFRIDSLNGDGYMSNEEIYNKCADLYDTDISTLTDAAEIKLAKRIQEMRDLYDGRGEADAAAKVMSKVESIQLSGAQHSLQIKTQDIVDAAKQYQVNTGVRTDNVIDEIADIQRVINNSALTGNDFWSGGYYKGLDADHKKLAKEVYKTKKLTTVVGNASQDKMDKEIIDKLKEQLLP